MNRIKIVLISILASFVISGFLNPIGLISGAVADAYGMTVTEAVARFGYFTMGVFAGYILSFYVFDFLKLKSVVVVGYVLIAASVAAVYILDSTAALVAGLFMIGVLASIQVCGASTLVSRVWHGKPRQTVLMAQDAMFNGGGIVFTALTTWFLAADMHWASTYAVVAVIVLLVATTAATTDIKAAQNGGDESRAETNWNLGILAVGGSVLLFMTAKISIFIWAPQYVGQAFGATIEQSGRLLSNVFTGAFFGSLVGTYIVSRVRIEFFLIGMLSIGASGLWLMLHASDLASALTTGYIVGASVGATFNGYMAFGLSFVKVPTHKNVAYVLLAGGIGSAIAPWFSSQVVETTGAVRDALVACFAIQIVVLFSVLLLTAFAARLRPAKRDLLVGTNTVSESDR
jgi:MFS transporter, TsgA protein